MVRVRVKVRVRVRGKECACGTPAGSTGTPLLRVRAWISVRAH